MADKFDLSALLQGLPKLDNDREQIEYIRLDLLDEDPNNFYQLSQIPELAANIQLCGLQQPIRVRATGNGRYQIVSGHRRRAAVALLAEEDPQKWEEVACIIEQDSASESLQQLRLIYANANTRTLTPAETSRQAEEVTKLLYQLKEEGYEFPGRMRDHVAEALKISKSKLARLKVIRENLSDFWMPFFENDSIAESTAVALAQLPRDEQKFIFDYCIERFESPAKVYASLAETYGKRLEAMKSLICPMEGIPCENVCAKKNATIRMGQYEYFHCEKCCSNCVKLLTCKYACPKLAEDIARQKAERKAAAQQATAEAAARHAGKVDQIRDIWIRFGTLREWANRSVREVVEAAGGIYHAVHDNKRYLKHERGLDIGIGTSLPFGTTITLGDVERLIALADCLGCSLDVLLGRKDPGCLEDVPKVGTMWHPISEEPPTGVDLVWLDGSGYSDTAEYYGGQRISQVSTIPWEEARWWAYLPGKE